MKCPQCGNEMVVDSHRRISLNMCYECGYIFDNRKDYTEKPVGIVTNFEHLKQLNLNELIAFLSPRIGVNEDALAEWLERPFE